ncbi:IS481 family transposase ISMdi4 [Methylobacterium mesophilicum]|nr:IS481 family transposase ISMdi4 [Methylobacterium mesophilicum]
MEGRALEQILHGSATTTETVRRAIQARKESVRAAAKHYGISPTTVQKWRSRPTSTDARMGPKEPHSTVLSLEHEAVIVAFRRHTLLPLDDCLYALQTSIPHLTRSSLHRCLQRHGISRLPEIDGDKPKRSRAKAYPIGYFHIDIAQVSTEQGKLHLFVAIDRTSKFAFVQLHEKATQRIAAAFPRDLVAAVPYTIHTVLTDNGIQFTDNKPVNAEAEAKAAAYWATKDGPRLYRWHSFEWACEQSKIEHRLTKPRCPWTNGQVERMNRTIKDATVKRYHYTDNDELRRHLQLFVEAYNYGHRLKTLRGLTPYEFICQTWTKEPGRFMLDPSHHMPGPNI